MTSIILYTTGDAYAYKYNPTTNYGSATELYIDPDGADESLTFLAFDVASNIPINSTILSATIYFYKSWNYSTGTLYIRAAIGSWTEGSLTWNNKPDVTLSDQGSVSITAALGWYSADITAMCQAWVSGTRTDYGLALDADSTAPVFKIYSKEYSSGIYKAYIDISYNLLSSTNYLKNRFRSRLDLGGYSLG